MDKQQKILDNVWKELNLGLSKSKHPFHIFSICTINNNKPDSRYVVLRDVNKDDKVLTFHTDKRSKKIKHIEAKNSACALFYDQQQKIQLRLYGDIYEVEDKLKIKERWKKSKNMSKLCYLNKIPPGEVIQTSKEYIYDENDLNYIENGIENFSVINIKISKIDWLNLNHKGHERMIISFLSNNAVKFEWVAP